MRITEIVIELDGALPKRNPIRAWRHAPRKIRVAFGGNHTTEYDLVDGSEDAQTLAWAQQVAEIATGKKAAATMTNSDVRDLADELQRLAL